ncbi:endocuticle structural glycoprotein SgAbd-3 [Drosophila obscura]|uniref:endocuticle structural glycoprotein SgAbd-3 n=1 Tax=Drosophila obscura TaxID=7282 RepID=UPI001BB167B3|nr:endocuticle structural glycoprotein SgAbd-3 [Drosophila obscura]
MRTLLLLALFAVAAWAAPDTSDLISQESNVEYNGKYHYHYELADGSKATQDGLLKTVNAEHDGEAVHGKYSFVSDDGQTYVVSYTADENGYHAVGDHLPTPPPTPLSVLKTLEYLKLHPYNPPEKQN